MEQLKITCKTGIAHNWKELKYTQPDFQCHSFLDEWRLAEFMKKAGYWCPIVINTNEEVLDGRLRLKALKMLEKEMEVPSSIPVVIAEGIDAKELTLQKNCSTAFITRAMVVNFAPDLDGDKYVYNDGNNLLQLNFRVDKSYYENIEVKQTAVPE